MKNRFLLRRLADRKPGPCNRPSGQAHGQRKLLIDKTTGIEKAIECIPDGATVMVGGFGVPGTPFCLIDELVRRNSRRLTTLLFCFISFTPLITIGLDPTLIYL